MPGWQPSGLSMAMAYLELPKDGGDVGLVGQVGEDLQLQERGSMGAWCQGTGSLLSSCPQVMEDSCLTGKGSVKPQSHQ